MVLFVQCHAPCNRHYIRSSYEDTEHQSRSNSSSNHYNNNNNKPEDITLHLLAILSVFSACVSTEHNLNAPSQRETGEPNKETKNGIASQRNLLTKIKLLKKFVCSLFVDVCCCLHFFVFASISFVVPNELVYIFMLCKQVPGTCVCHGLRPMFHLIFFLVLTTFCVLFFMFQPFRSSVEQKVWYDNQLKVFVFHKIYTKEPDKEEHEVGGEKRLCSTCFTWH